ncbi:MAG: HRDC domain-containing protein, partial [Oscillospiraceae bacterium]
RTKERFGGKMIIDILRGSKNAKILEMQFDKLATYNISQYSELRLRAIMDYLLENDYLLKTDEKFPVIKLGEKSKEVLFDKVSLTMQICSDDEIEAAPYQEKHSFGKAENILLSSLRELRLKLSAEQHVPAYVVFPDSTLIDMCMKMPTNPEAFLKVSGVGAVKLQKYGKLFMDVIESFADSKASENPQPREEGGEENPPKEEISLEAEISLEPISIKHIADKINCVRLQNSLPKITALKLNSLLLDLGYLEIRDTDYGRSFKAASEKGIAAGIKSENCIIRNSPCIVTYYNEAAQKMVIELAEKM